MKLRVQTDAARNIAVRGILRRHGGGHRCSRCSLCKSENNVFDNFTVEMWRGPQTAWGKACSAAWENLWMAWPLSRRHVFKSDSGACVLEEVASWTPLLNSNCERRGWIFFTGFRVGHMYHMYHTAQHNKKNMIPSLELSRRLKRIFSHHSYHSCSSGQHWSTCLGAKLPGISSCIEGLDGAPAFNLGGWASLKNLHGGHGVGIAADTLKSIASMLASMFNSTLKWENNKKLYIRNYIYSQH